MGCTEIYLHEYSNRFFFVVFADCFLVDINECCLGVHICASLGNGGQCNNTIGSFECLCRDGYNMTMDPDEKCSGVPDRFELSTSSILS